MNIVQLQEQLKNFSQDQLIKEMQMPSGATPQFLVLGEIMRRQKMQQEAANNAKAPQTTVAEDAVVAAGVPSGGIADMARALAPKSDIANNTGVKAMAHGGSVKKMAAGDRVVQDGVIFIEQADGSYVQAAPTVAPPPVAGAPNRRDAFNTAREQDDSNTLSNIVDPILTPLGDFGAAVAGRTVEEQRKIDEERAAAAAAETAAAAPVTPPVPAEDPTAPADETAPAAPGGTSGGGIGGLTGAATDYEKELLDTLARREQAAEQDKWLALAQVGLNMMSSDNPTMMGAIGEAGLTGVEAAKTARDQYDKDRIDILGAIEESKIARANAAAAAARAAGGGSPAKINSTILGNYQKQLDAVNSELAALGPVPEPSWWSGEIDDPNAGRRQALMERAGLLEQALAYGYATHGAPYIGSDVVVSGEYDYDVSDPDE